MQRLPLTSDKHAKAALAIEPITMRIPDACRYIGIGRSTLYLLIARGQVEVVKVGRSTLVLTASLKRLVAARRLSKPIECHNRTASPCQ